MPRLLALLAGLSLLAGGCGTAGTGVTVPPVDQSTAAASAHRVDKATAEQAFQLLTRLDQALEQRDCATVDELTTWAAKALGGRACEATRNGRPALYSEPEFLLPDEADWFAALAREPSPAYFLFLLEGNRWRLGAGPIPVAGKVPAYQADSTADPDSAAAARLAPQRHLTFLTDPAGVQGVRFAAGDPLRALLKELVAKPGKVSPDRLSVDVELLDGPARAVALSDTALLVFDALRIACTQRPAAGRSSLSHRSLAGSETVSLASVITVGGGFATVGILRA